MKTAYRSVRRSLLGTTALMVISGCASTLVSNIPDTEPGFHSRPMLQDRVLAIGRIVRKEDSQPESPARLAFLGEKNSYLVTEGVEALLEIANSSVGPFIEVDSGYQDPASRLYLRDGSFWGALSLTTSRKALLNEEQQRRLIGLGFESDGTAPRSGFTKHLQIKGVTARKVELPPNLVAKLSHERVIEFYRSPDEAAPVNSRKKLLAPLAFGADVATAPVQLLGIGALFIYVEATGGIRIIQ